MHALACRVSETDDNDEPIPPKLSNTLKHDESQKVSKAYWAANIRDVHCSIKAKEKRRVGNKYSSLIPNKKPL